MGVGRACVRHASLVVVVALAACGSNGPAAPEGIFLPRLTGEPPQFGVASIGGTFVEDRGCLVLTDVYLSAESEPPSPGAVALLVWPEGSNATRTDGALDVDPPGMFEVVTGQPAFVDGGFMPLDDAEQLIGEPIPAECQVGLYWVVTRVALPDP